MRIAFLTGAGMSAESGVPTFRDALTGLWARFDPQRLATPEAFAENPALVWGWYRWRAARVAAALPNAGHAGIARLEALGHRVEVITQNVDDLHERAGSSRVHHLHGRLLASRCAACGARRAPDPILDGSAMEDGGAREAPPQCTDCGGSYRPDVVWFGEALPQAPWEKACAAIDGCELAVVIGTSGLVQPAASLPALALARGVPVLEINPDATPLSTRVDALWRVPASRGIAALLERLEAAARTAPRDLIAAAPL
ncbi:NAD-dependent deacylase [Luteimonas sp. SJ-92]|uniref:NAD-dependent protein deacylase n=1 Tax=Luteimonas salinisoli TaxID=2752307 RepID=A0A853JIR2_9GAMM|nr:NAD-dependent deacylase [Luteimonas salinisoli]NZA28624.1 NAD-dependent deacylase [Luteimonas salinisoli]